MAARIIAKSDRSHPADTVLRQELRHVPALNRLATAEVSRAVFAFYRWHGWLDHRRPVTAGLKRAMELAAGYAERPESFSDEKMLARCVPDWIRGELEVTPGWVRLLQAEPRLWLRARGGQARELASKLGQARAAGLPGAVIHLGDQDLFRHPEFQAGSFEIQDLSSQAVGLWCAPQPGQTWWDACAGEGGKTLHLSDLMGNKGLIWASDRADWRLRRLRMRAARAGCFNYRAAFWDGSQKLPTKTRFDGILVDAPCSGVGTWHRNPHARWTTTPQDVRELAEVQGQLLLHAAPSLKPGGRLIYAVCTLTRSETDGVADALERQRPELEPLPLPDLFEPGQPAAPRRWLWPQDYGGNGMFVAAWRRRA